MSHRGEKKGSGHSKATRSKPTAAPSTSYATSGPAWSTYSNAGSFPESATDDVNSKYDSESQRRRDYAMGLPGVAPPDPRRPSHDGVIKAASDLPGRTAQTSSTPVAYPTQLNFDGSDDESYNAGSNHGHYGHNGGGQTSSSYYSSSSSAYPPHSSSYSAYPTHSSSGQQPSSYYSSTSGSQGSSLYYSHMSGGQGGSSYYGSSSRR